MSFLDEIFNSQKKKDKDSDLEDWQQKELDKGNYREWNFEEEELEEDDYYFEDEE